MRHWMAWAIDRSSVKLHGLEKRFSSLWLFGTLFKCNASNFLSALYEFVHGLVFATMPFWLGGLVLLVLAPPPSAQDLGSSSSISFWVARYWASVVSMFSRGELLLFAISLLSPTLWLATYEPKGANPLPHRRPISTLAVLIIVVGAVLFGLMRKSETVNVDAVFWISVALAGAAVFLRYLVFVYHGYRMPDVSERDLTKPTEEWLRNVSRHREATQ